MGSVWRVFERRGFEDGARFRRDHSHPTRSDPKGACRAEPELEEDVDASAMSHPGVMILSFPTTSTRENYPYNVQFIQVFHSVEIKVPSLLFITASHSFHRFISSLHVCVCSLFISIFYAAHHSLQARNHVGFRS